MTDIIGRIGARKLALCKVLLRITEPTGDYAEINCVLGSFLVVGIAFHHELTG